MSDIQADCKVKSVNDNTYSSGNDVLINVDLLYLQSNIITKTANLKQCFIYFFCHNATSVGMVVIFTAGVESVVSLHSLSLSSSDAMFSLSDAGTFLGVLRFLISSSVFDEKLK